MNTQSSLKIEQTPEQTKQIEQIPDRQVPTVKLTLQELDERVAPWLVDI